MRGKPEDNQDTGKDARERLRAVFGEVLPETTNDERTPEKPESDTDTWYRENRPPHHDDG
ncbi:hypothetical protein GCM10012275_60870 [Longimycelium tulufanense]|uniref:Uncharacterized protein n=1 Tax=Longimycelium tulufanense TaxID=907463 RepID=A0A8J3FXS1_9PSEU|nr:hypothetical protein [Longimycelium tulufanense]GGM82064.1 hypothetical protein GCM10012275_60870 [Longimycelium tulufanense]